MKVLFDQGTPVPLRRSLPGYSVDTAFELGWATLHNGDLLNRAEAEGYDLLITTDQQLRHQQNLSGRRLAILVLCSTSWSRIQAHVGAIRETLSRMQPGSTRSWRSDRAPARAIRLGGVKWWLTLHPLSDEVPGLGADWAAAPAQKVRSPKNEYWVSRPPHA